MKIFIEIQKTQSQNVAKQFAAFLASHLLNEAIFDLSWFVLLLKQKKVKTNYKMETICCFCVPYDLFLFFLNLISKLRGTFFFGS